MEKNFTRLDKRDFLSEFMMLAIALVGVSTSFGLMCLHCVNGIEIAGAFLAQNFGFLGALM